MGYFDKESMDKRAVEKNESDLAWRDLDSIAANLQPACARIIHDMKVNNIGALGATLTFGMKESEKQVIARQTMILEQNWIIIRALDNLSKQLEALTKAVASAQNQPTAAAPVATVEEAHVEEAPAKKTFEKTARWDKIDSFTIRCRQCGKKQNINRTLCWECGAQFVNSDGTPKE